MKKTLFSKIRLGKDKFAAVAAVALVPLTASALYDSSGEFYNFVSVGYNYLSSYSSAAGILLVGHYNGIHSALSSTSTSGAMAIGSYNIINDRGSVVIGTWNKDTSGDELFILGNGTYGTPSNAMEVFKNGKIRILRQGDISMGAYSN